MRVDRLRHSARELAGLALALAAAGAVAAAPAAAAMHYPATRTDVVRDTLHGTIVEDPYRWLEDGKSPDTRAWLDRQIAFTHDALAKIPGREAIHARFEQLLKVESLGMPMARGPRVFFPKRTATQDLPVLCYRDGDGPDQVLVDPNALSADHARSAAFEDIALDGSRVAVGIRAGGQDEVEVSFLDVATRHALADTLPRGDYLSVTMTPDGRGVYYAKILKDASRLYYHAFGTPVSADPVVFGDGLSPQAAPTSALSQDGRHLMVTVVYGSAADQTELYVKDLTRANAPYVPLIRGIPARFQADMTGDRVYVYTNWKAPNRRIVAFDLAHPDTSHWQVLVPEGPVPIADLTLAGGRLFVTLLDHVKSRLLVCGPDGRTQHEIEFPALGSVSGVSGLWNEPAAYFTFTSFHIPKTIYRYDVPTQRQTVWWRSNAPVASDAFELSQVWYPSRDGTKIPMFVLAPKGAKLDGSHPTFLTGYGGFGMSETPYFSSTAVQWVEHGGVFAMPNLRGGAEFGEQWHRNGMLDKKQNSFDDFIAAAEYLIHAGYTSPQKLAIVGGSNGGLLVGAALTQRPELFKAVVCQYPLLDMLRYQKFLVARFWVPEYGSSDDPQQLPWLLAYSPYQHVKPGVKYPAIMLVTGDSDTRVDPLHARKMAARLQAATASDEPVLLHYDTQSGHSGGNPIGKTIDDATDETLFLFGALGVGAPTSESRPNITP